MLASGGKFNKPLTKQSNLSCNFIWKHQSIDWETNGNALSCKSLKQQSKGRNHGVPREDQNIDWYGLKEGWEREKNILLLLKDDFILHCRDQILNSLLSDFWFNTPQDLI